MCTWFFLASFIEVFTWLCCYGTIIYLAGWNERTTEWMDEWKLIWQGRMEEGGRRKEKLMSWVVCRIKECSAAIKKRWLIKMKNIMTDLSESNRQKGKKWLSGSWSEKIEEFTKLTYCALHRASCIKCVHSSNHNHSRSDVYNHSLATRTAFLLIQLFLDFLF